jgi:hypothetical protein
MAFVRQLPDQLAVFQGGASRTGTYDEGCDENGPAAALLVGYVSI